MKNLRKLSRRSFMARVVGGAVIGGGAIAALGGRASAFQVTDADTGPNSDPANRSGITDSDTGPTSDRPGCGRGGG